MAKPQMVPSPTPLMPIDQRKALPHGPHQRLGTSIAVTAQQQPRPPGVAQRSQPEHRTTGESPVPPRVPVPPWGEEWERGRGDTVCRTQRCSAHPRTHPRPSEPPQPHGSSRVRPEGPGPSGAGRWDGDVRPVGRTRLPPRTPLRSAGLCLPLAHGAPKRLRGGRRCSCAVGVLRVSVSCERPCVVGAHVPWTSLFHGCPSPTDGRIPRVSLSHGCPCPMGACVPWVPVSHGGPHPMGVLAQWVFPPHGCPSPMGVSVL